MGRSGDLKTASYESESGELPGWPHNHSACMPPLPRPDLITQFLSISVYPRASGSVPQLLHREAHLAAPIGILPGGAGKVLLRQFLGEVFLVDRQKLRRRQRQKAHHGVVQLPGQLRIGVRRRAAGRAASAPARTAGPASSASPLRGMRFARRAPSSSIMPAARRASMSAPTQKPASVGRSCVVEETSACRGYSSCRRNSPFVLFEIEQAVTQNAEARQRLAHRRLHGSQVLAHHHHAVAHALQRQNAHEIVGALAHVGALGWRRSRRESSRGGTGASRDRCAARRRGGNSCGWIRRTGGSRPRDGGRSWAAESPSPGPSERNRRAASPRGSRTRRTAGAPTGRSRSGRWPAPGRGTARWTGGGRAPAAARRRNCMSICHCRYW